MHMKKNKIFWLFILIIGQSCTNNSIKKITIAESSYLKKYTQNQRSGIAPDLIVDSINVYSEIEIIPYTLDSIMAKISIINDWVKPIWIYKPLLPDDSLAEVSFSIISDKMQVDFDEVRVDPILKVTKHKYLVGDGHSLMSSIIPDISDNNVLELNVGERIICTTNLSKHFDFKNFAKKANHSKSLLLSYFAYFPFIENKQHVFGSGKNDIIDNIGHKRPVYFGIGNKLLDTPKHKGWVKFELPNH